MKNVEKEKVATMIELTYRALSLGDKAFKDEDDGFASLFFEVQNKAGEVGLAVQSVPPTIAYEFEFYTPNLDNGFFEKYQELAEEDEEKADEWRRAKMEEEENKTVSFFRSLLEKLKEEIEKLK